MSAEAPMNSPTDVLRVRDCATGTLADNGGPTQTHSLQADSPAIDAGDTYAVPPDLHDADGDNFTDGPVGVDRDFHDRFVGVPYIPDTGVCNPEDEPIDLHQLDTSEHDRRDHGGP